MAAFPFKSGDRIVFQGDSITDAGRQADPYGYGEGYVAMIKGMLAVAGAGVSIEVINRGLSGDRSSDLLKRWQADALDLKPTHVSVMIGVNDIWRKFDHLDTWVDLPDYKANVEKMLDSAAEAGMNLILMTPTTVDADPVHESNIMCGEYAAVIEEFANKYGAILVPARDRMWAAVESGPSVEFYLPDGVHPSVAGHAVLAASWLEAVGVVKTK